MKWNKLKREFVHFVQTGAKKDQFRFEFQRNVQTRVRAIFSSGLLSLIFLGNVTLLSGCGPDSSILPSDSDYATVTINTPFTNSGPKYAPGFSLKQLQPITTCLSGDSLLNANGGTSFLRFGVYYKEFELFEDIRPSGKTCYDSLSTGTSGSTTTTFIDISPFQLKVRKGAARNFGFFGTICKAGYAICDAAAATIDVNFQRAVTGFSAPTDIYTDTTVNVQIVGSKTGYSSSISSSSVFGQTAFRFLRVQSQGYSDANFSILSGGLVAMPIGSPASILIGPHPISLTSIPYPGTGPNTTVANVASSAQTSGPLLDASKYLIWWKNTNSASWHAVIVPIGKCQYQVLNCKHYTEPGPPYATFYKCGSNSIPVSPVNGLSTASPPIAVLDAYQSAYNLPPPEARPELDPGAACSGN